jgi:hypothetical protein
MWRRGSCWRSWGRMVRTPTVAFRSAKVAIRSFRRKTRYFRGAKGDCGPGPATDCRLFPAGCLGSWGCCKGPRSGLSHSDPSVFPFSLFPIFPIFLHDQPPLLEIGWKYSASPLRRSATILLHGGELAAIRRVVSDFIDGTYSPATSRNFWPPVAPVAVSSLGRVPSAEVAQKLAFPLDGRPGRMNA